jgi:hypothetical protein
VAGAPEGARQSLHCRPSRIAAGPQALRLRHAGISWRLNSGAPATLVAEWAGHTVEVLYRIYAHCLDGDDERWFARMEEALCAPL